MHDNYERRNILRYIMMGSAVSQGMVLIILGIIEVSDSFQLYLFTRFEKSTRNKIA